MIFLFYRYWCFLFLNLCYNVLRGSDVMKKILTSLVALCMTLTIASALQDVHAIDFSKKESYYIKLCSSSRLTQKNKKTCEQFNTYLKKKNAELKNDIKETKKDLANTKDDIDDVSSKINTLDSSIDKKENEINYLLKSINNIQKNIKDKEKKMSERMYAMQTYYNSNSLIQFLFGAEDFSDFFSRLNSINDITSYEKELVDELASQKKELNKQKSSLVDAKAALQAQKNSADSLKNKLVNLETQQQNQIASSQAESKKISKAQKEIDDTLTEMMNSIAQGDSGGSAVQGNQGNAKVGYNVAQKALSKLGSPYYWGAAGPSMFDCSGLVAWAHKAAGVGIGRTTANAYAHSGKSISASQLQAGDIVAFRRTNSSRYHHIAIYIGNGIVVHASGEGSTCLGNHVSKGHVVKRTPLSSFSKYAKAYRRLY